MQDIILTFHLEKRNIPPGENFPQGKNHRLVKHAKQVRFLELASKKVPHLACIDAAICLASGVLGRCVRLAMFYMCRQTEQNFGVGVFYDLFFGGE